MRLSLTVVAALAALLAGPGCAEDRLEAGLPSAGDEVGPVRVLENDGFTVGWSTRRGAALWADYDAREVRRRRYLERPPYRPDPRVPDADGAGYRDSGFDRGHLAPNYLIGNLYGPSAQRDSFLMTNIAPQRPRLNQLVWQRLEEIEADHVASRRGRLWVTLGPVFDENRAFLEGGTEIPDAFYRLWLARDDRGRPRALALLVPQQVRGDERLDRFLVSVDRVEEVTGLDFYAALDDEIEERIESRVADPEAWGLAEVVCMPARYRDDWQGRDGIVLNFDRCE